MEEQIRQHKFLEYGEHNGNLYGTSLDSIRNVINEGKMCVLDCSPSVSEFLSENSKVTSRTRLKYARDLQSLKILHNSAEFRPYVIFIAAPKMETLKNLYDYSYYNKGSTRTLTVMGWQSELISRVCYRCNAWVFDFNFFSWTDKVRFDTVRVVLALWSRWLRCTRYERYFETVSPDWR